MFFVGKSGSVQRICRPAKYHHEHELITEQQMAARSRFLTDSLWNFRGTSLFDSCSFFPALVLILMLACALALTAPAASQETSGQALAKLEKLPAESRQKFLVERA